MNGQLRQRAEQIEHYVSSHLIDANGIAYTFIDKDSSAPLTDRFFDGYDAYAVDGYTPAEFYSYENCGMTTGAYAQAMVCRYRVDGSATAIDRARRSIDGLRSIYECGRQLEEGFFPKIYGGRFSLQTSTDQVLYAVMAMDRFSDIATPAEKRQIDRMISQMIRFWTNRSYRYTYFNLVDMQWPLARFPSLLLLAFNHSGDAMFKREYERLLADGVNRHPGEQQLTPKLAGEWPASDYEQLQQAWYVAHIGGCTGMDVLELDYLLRHDAINSWASFWKNSSQQMWREGTALLAPDGSEYSGLLFDFKTHTPRRPTPQWFQADDYVDLDSWAFSRYVHAATSGFSTLTARSGVQWAGHADDRDAVMRTVRKILGGLDVQNLTYYNEPERFAGEYRYLAKFIAGDSAANWLWAYWLARKEGFIDEDE